MDTPKRELSWLENFPPDIWAYFVSYLPGEQLERLIMTGATLLSQRLKSPTVVKSIKLGQDFMVFKSCSKFLSDFPFLEELSIHSCHEQWSSNLGLTLDSIPSKTRKIELDGNWSISAINSFVGSRGDANLSKHLPCLETLDLLRLDIGKFDWIAKSPQSLTSLSLQRWDGTVELPRSLLEFKALHVVLSTSTFVSKLPPSLESFVSQVELKGVDLLLPLLPPSTRTLHLGYISEYADGAALDPNLLLELPQSLTWLKVRGFQIQGVRFDFATNPELISLLSSTLTELNTGIIPASVWPILPRNLTTLYLETSKAGSFVVSKIKDENGVLHEVKSIPFDSLPRSITRLTLTTPHPEQYLCSPPTWEYKSSFFPPQLSYLKLYDIHFCPDTAKLLPSTLTHLEIANMCERVCEHLPSGLKTLISNAAFISPNLIKFLPKNLTCLRLGTGELYYSSWFDYKTGEDIDFDFSDYECYPGSHEPLVPSNFEWKYPYALPPTLLYLEIRIPGQHGDSFLLHQPLPNLLELTLQSLPVLSIPSLPPYLTKLYLCSASHFSGKSFQFLPKSLTDICLNGAESIFDSDIQYLPRSLKKASFMNAIHLTNLCIGDLPPHLESLRLLHNDLITTSCFPKLPYPIRSTQIGGTISLSKWYVVYGKIINKS